MKNRKAQAWGFDLIAGLIIFLVGIVSFYLYTTNLPGASEQITQQLQQDGELIADSLLSEGNPANWSTSDVVKIGLLSEEKINQTKLDSFRSLASTDYNRTLSLFRVRNNYYIYFGEESSTGIGKNLDDAANIIKVTRIVVYDNSIKILSVNAWN
jgi:hypothetical protein